MDLSIKNKFYFFIKLFNKLKYFVLSLLFTYDNSDEDENLNCERILDFYGGSILRLAYSYLHNMEDSEDILQDTLIKLIEKSPNFENSKHEKAWLMTVASNLSKNKIRYNFIRKTDSLNEELIADSREDLSFVWEQVKKLPEKYREVIHLYYYEGYKTHEIAKILNKKDSTIRSILARGRDRLKLTLKEEFDFE